MLRPRLARPLVLIVLAIVLTDGCADRRERDPSPAVPPPRIELTGRAVLPADTFAPGPLVGTQLDSLINGRRPPFRQVPVQGFSSILIAEDGGGYLLLQDNGFGTRANSPDHPLRWYRAVIDLDGGVGGRPGTVTIRSFQNLRDPRGLLPFVLSRGGPGRMLTGADLDPESFARSADGTIWLGEEFGPFLVPCEPDGSVKGPPVAPPIPAKFAAFGRGHDLLRSPDHPDLQRLSERERLRAASLPRSGGFEGLAVSADGTRMYAALEKALVDDPQRSRRLIMEFDPALAAFTGRAWTYRTDDPAVSIGSLESCGPDALLVLERDADQGAEARIKRIYLVDLGERDDAGDLRKRLVCDLLAIRDDNGLTRFDPGAVGLGPRYSFPYVTPECLLVLNPRNLLVANDNNFPFSSGRRPPETPDDNEFIRLRLPWPLDAMPQ